MATFSKDIIRVKLTQTNRNDCAITSLSVFEDMSYNNAFEIFKSGYKRSRGTQNFKIYDYMCPKYDCLVFHKNSHFWLNTRYNKLVNDNASKFRLTKFDKGITLKSFCKKYNVGKYYVIVRGHALVIDNGVVIDTSLTPDATRVRVAWKL